MSDVHTRIDDEDGRYRAVAEVEVPGTPEQVWQTISTGPGVEAWFVPAEVEPRLGGRFTTHHGVYGSSEGVITAWEPPRRLAYDEADWQGPDTPVPTWNTEIVVEAVSGDTCVVRLSSGFLAGGDDWHDDVEHTLDGWTGALHTLRLYLTHFAGLPATTLLVQHELPAGTTVPDMIAAAGLRDAAVGDEVSTTPPTPHLRGVVQHVTDDEIVLRMSEPMPGLFEFATSNYGGVSAVVAFGYLYGTDGEPVRDREQGAWQAWVADQVGRAEQPVS